MANALYELSINQHDGAGNFFMSRLNWEIAEPASPDPYAIAAAVIDGFDTHIRVQWLALQGDDVLLDFYKCKRVLATGGPSALKLSGEAGSGAVACASSGLSADIQLQNTNPSNRPGHIYVGGVTNGALLASQWQAAFSTKVADLILKLVTGFTVGASTAVLSVLEKKLHAWTHAAHMNLNPKATLLNKRTVPLA